MKGNESYPNRPEFFKGVRLKDWKDWRWQQRNAIRTSARMAEVLPGMSVGQIENLAAWMAGGFRFLLTPYVLSLTKRDKKGLPLKDDSVWRQVFPMFEKSLRAPGARGKGGAGIKAGPDEYSSVKENWEDRREMLTPICQHKYENRAIVYVSDSCLGYCMFCFRSLQSCAGEERHGGLGAWRATLKEIKRRQEIEEVILSGGDPLVLSNEMIEKMLSELRAIKTVRTIRIHTRAWMHNPFRIDREFCRLLKKHSVTEMGVHVIHPNEITPDFIEAVGRIRASGAGTLLLADIPLVRGVNDDAAMLKELFMGLYEVGVKPYYLSHNMPNIPFAAQQRTSVREGLAIYNKLKRRISNPAMPEYIITHKNGKKTVPECMSGTPDFVYAKDGKGWPIIRFRDWNGKWRTYLDAKPFLY